MPVADREIPKLTILSGICFFPKCVKIRNRNSHIKLLKNIFFWNKVFYVDNYFMENSLTLRTHVSATQFHIAIIHWPYGRNVGDTTLLIQCKIFWRYWLFFHSFRPLHHDSSVKVLLDNSNIYKNSHHMAEWNMFDVVNSVILKFPTDVCNFPLLFSHSKNIRMSTLECFENFFLLF